MNAKKVHALLGFMVTCVCISLVIFLISCEKSTSSTNTTKTTKAAEEKIISASGSIIEKSDTTDNPTMNDPSERTEVKDPGDDSEQGDGGVPPQAVFPETSFDVGEVEQGSVIEHVFTVKNVGPGVLRILSAKPS